MSAVEDKLRDLLQSLEKERKDKDKADAGAKKVSEKEAKAIRAISDKFKRYGADSKLTVGSIVKWKAGMRNRRFPTNDGVAIVTRIYDKPVYDAKNDDSGSPAFHEPLDLVLGIVDEDNDFVEFHYDGKRFELASPMDAPPRQVAVLRERLELLNKPEEMHVGDIVTWKKGLRNKKHPEPGCAGLVVKVLDQPTYDTATGSGSPYFQEPLTIVVGIIDSDGDFLCFHSDARRFTHIPEL